jgi:hypothetical protein
MTIVNQLKAMRALIVVLTFVLQTQLPFMALPEGNGAWVVRVVTTGGLMGIGSGDFTFSSEKKIMCSAQIQCPKEFKASDLQPLIEGIQPDILLPVVPVVSLCRDCITRTMTIRRRDPSGLEQTFTASWDDTTKARLPREVIQIYDAVVDLMK